ncbi:MAG: TetR family transcriptional regulator [Alphaproteobacteria bacterium]|nr:TetR family transcriptional regulator [Alphaproteobacteria bacterium]
MMWLRSGMRRRPRPVSVRRRAKKGHAGGTGGQVDALVRTGRVRSREGTRQAEKSDHTRRQILDAAIECLAVRGFNSTTMTVIAKTAGLSRGAMQYHFETMTDVLRATLAYIQQIRLTLLRKSATRPGNDAVEERFAIRIERMWRFLFEPVSIAFFEIAVASRTDPSLAALMEQAHQSFWDEWVAAALASFPEWEGRQADLELACGLAQTLLEGLVAQELTHRSSAVGAEKLKAYLVDCVREIFDRGQAEQPAPRSAETAA